MSTPNSQPKLYFGLLVTRKDGSQFFAGGGKGAPTALFHRYGDAGKFRRELETETGIASKVVRIRASFELHLAKPKGGA